MSRIGQKPIPIPDGVKAAVNGRTVSVEGPIGKLSWTHRPEISVQVNESEKLLLVTRKDDDRASKSLHGLTRSIIANMVQGCLEGYSKSLEVYGVGYGVQLQGQKFLLNCGRSHPVAFDVPDGIKIAVQAAQARGETEPARFTISGRQAGGGRAGREGSKGQTSRTVQGQGRALRRRTRPPQARQGLCRRDRHVGCP